MTLQETIATDFQSYLKQAGTGSFTELRAAAYNEFSRLGFPTTKHEEWKYTNLKTITEKSFQSTCELHTDLSGFIQSSIFGSIEANRLVFVNGTFVESLSVIKDNTGIITTLTGARKNHAALFDKHFGQYAKIEGEALNALNTALLSDGAFVHVAAKEQLQYPVLVLHIADASTMNVLAQPRNLFITEAHAQASIIEAYLSIGANASFTNTINEVYVGEQAQFDHYKIQQQTGESYQNNYTQLFQEGNTQINHVTLTLDGTMVRNNLHFYMNGENCNSVLYGLYITDGKQHVDNHTRVDHAKPNCFSDEKYKGILKDQSTAVFNGKILVHLDAQKTNAYQRNQNILLSDEATVNTKPQLEIFADDVKCTHGATIGQLDEEPMFYLRSRGIPEDVARKMLLNAFADDIAEKIRIPALVELLEAQIDAKL